MKIIVENEREQKLIEQLCDVALRAGGLSNDPAVHVILSSIVEPDEPTGVE